MPVTVARLAITPIKSTGLQHPDGVMLHAFGVEENRRFYIADPEGRMVNNTRCGPLMALRSEWRRDGGHDEWLRLAFPDGSAAEGDPAALGRAVRTSFYGRWVSAREVLGPFASALSGYAGRPLVLARTDRPGDGSDGFPVSLSSQASAEELARRSGSERALDSRRFRMLIEVEGCGPHQEDSWVRGRVRVGEAVIRIAEPVGRCVITTLHPDTGTKDLDTLEAIKAYRGVSEDAHIEFGVYADVVRPGRVQVGDAVTPLPRGS